MWGSINVHNFVRHNPIAVTGIATAASLLLTACGTESNSDAAPAPAVTVNQVTAEPEPHQMAPESIPTKPVESENPTVESITPEIPKPQPTSDIWLPVNLTADYHDEVDNRIQVKVDFIEFDVRVDRVEPARPLDGIPDELVTWSLLARAGGSVSYELSGTQNPNNLSISLLVENESLCQLQNKIVEAKTEGHLIALGADCMTAFIPQLIPDLSDYSALQQSSSSKNSEVFFRDLRPTETIFLSLTTTESEKEEILRSIAEALANTTTLQLLADMAGGDANAGQHYHRGGASSAEEAQRRCDRWDGEIVELWRNPDPAWDEQARRNFEQIAGGVFGGIIDYALAACVIAQADRVGY